MGGSGDQVRAARRASGVSQRELAARSGINQPHIAKIESGRVQPTQTTLSTLLRHARPRPSAVLSAHRAEVMELVSAQRGRSVKVFGSVARGTDTSESDIDLLVTFDEGAGLFNAFALAASLEELLGYHVDVMSTGSTGRAAENARREAVPL